MLRPDQLHEYQRENVQHVLDHPHSMLWLQMGLGKTIIALTAITERMRVGQVKKVLIFGPLRVISSVWDTECRKWEHTRNLRCSIITGNQERRVRALTCDADIYLCNYENMSWLAKQIQHYWIDAKRPFPFDMVVYDEITQLKNSTSKRMSGGVRTIKDSFGKEVEVKVMGWRKLIPMFAYRVGLTGTPASNGYVDLMGQYLAIDNGDRLGKYKTHYLNSFFRKGFDGWSHEITPHGKDLIEFKISDITKKMDAADYLDLPPCTVIDRFITLPPKVMTKYRDLEKDLMTKLDSGEEIELFNKASLSNKCLQFCNGTPYTDLEGSYNILHDEKLKALEKIVDEAAGQPVLCSYLFKSDAERIMNYFKKIKPVNLTAAKSSDTRAIIERWNRGTIKLLIGHPKSMGHGIDGLQQSGSIVVWFGITWSYELYEQMNGRIMRQGQTKPVTVIRIVADGTIDLAVKDAIINKHSTQDGLKKAIDNYRKGYIKADDFDFL